MSTAGTQGAGKGTPGPKRVRTRRRNGVGGVSKSLPVEGGQAPSVQKAEEPSTSAAVSSPTITQPALPLSVTNDAGPSISSSSPGICKSFRVTGRCRVGPGCKYEHVRDQPLASVEGGDEIPATQTSLQFDSREMRRELQRAQLEQEGSAKRAEDLPSDAESSTSNIVPVYKPPDIQGDARPGRIPIETHEERWIRLEAEDRKKLARQVQEAATRETEEERARQLELDEQRKREAERIMAEASAGPEGRCRDGAGSKCEHVKDQQPASSRRDVSGSAPSGTQIMTANVTQGTTNANPTSGSLKPFCHAWRRSGTCRRGDECPYEHTSKDAQRSGTSTEPSASKANRSQRRAQGRIEAEKRRKELERQAEEAAAREREEEERARVQIELEDQRRRDVERVLAEHREEKAKEEERRRARQARRLQASRRAEEARLEDQRRAEEARLIEEQRKREAKAKEEEQRRAEQERRRLEQTRLDEKRRAEQARLFEEQRRREAKAREEEQRRAEQERRRVELARLEEQRRAEQVRLLEEQRGREAKAREEEQRRAEQERRRVEQARIVEEQRKREVNACEEGPTCAMSTQSMVNDLPSGTPITYPQFAIQEDPNANQSARIRREAEAEIFRRYEQLAKTRKEAEAEIFGRGGELARTRRVEEAARLRSETDLANQKAEADQDRIRRAIEAARGHDTRQLPQQQQQQQQQQEEGGGWCIVM